MLHSRLALDAGDGLVQLQAHVNGVEASKTISRSYYPNAMHRNRGALEDWNKADDFGSFEMKWLEQETK